MYRYLFQTIRGHSFFCMNESTNCCGKQTLCWCCCSSILHTSRRNRWFYHKSDKCMWQYTNSRETSNLPYRFLDEGNRPTTKHVSHSYKRRKSKSESMSWNIHMPYGESLTRYNRTTSPFKSSIPEVTACMLLRHFNLIYNENYSYLRCENSNSGRIVIALRECIRRRSSCLFFPVYVSDAATISEHESALSGSTTNSSGAVGYGSNHKRSKLSSSSTSCKGNFSNNISSFSSSTSSLSSSSSRPLSFTNSFNILSNASNGFNSCRKNFTFSSSRTSVSCSRSGSNSSSSSHSLGSGSSSFSGSRSISTNSGSELRRVCNLSSSKRNYHSDSRNSLHSSRNSLNTSRNSTLDDDVHHPQQHERHRIRLPSSGFLRLPDIRIRPLQIVLVGRPNVGKSMLFNRLLSGTRPCINSRRRSRDGSNPSSAAVTVQTDCHLRREQLLQQAIVSSQAGTTRDRRIARAVFGQLQLLLVDTGGLEDKDVTQASQLLTHMRKQVRVALRDADCVLFVVDATEGITPIDVLLARLVKEWLHEDEKQKLSLQCQQGRNRCQQSSGVLTVRAMEKNVGGRPAMQQHRSGGRRLLLLPSFLSSAAPIIHPSAAAFGQFSREGAKDTQALSAEEAAGATTAEDTPDTTEERQLLTAVETAKEVAARETRFMASNGARQAIAAVFSEQETSKGIPMTTSSETISQDFSVPVILVANKADGCFLGSYLSDCYDLDLGSPVIVSAKKNEGFDDLYDRLVLEIGHRQRAPDALWPPAEASTVETEHDTEAASTLRGETEGSPAETEGATDEERYICERVLRPPQPSGEAGTWIEGLMRRYGRCGLNESYKQLCDPSSSMHLPWDLSRTSLAAAVSGSPTATSDAENAGIDRSIPPRSTTTAASTYQQEEKVTAAEAEWQQASAGVILPVEQESLSLRSRRTKLRTKEGRDRFLSLKRQLLFDETIHLAVIGRPNVGKSTLVNALLGQERMIVSDEPGTTTDAIASDWEYKRHPFCLIDTSGVTRGWKMKHTDLLLEAGMQTLRNIRRSQVCILCVDGSAAEASGIPVNAHELALAHLATSKEGRCLVVCVTKWDLVSEQQRERTRTEILERLQSGLGHLKGCPVVFTAAKHGHNLDTLMNRVLLLYRRWNTRVPTSKLNSWLQQFLLRFPPPWRLGSRCQIKYLTQVKARPPTFVAWSNVYSAFPVNYQRQIQNAIREEFSLGGTPIRFILRTTANLPTGRRLSKKEYLKWRRKTHITVRESFVSVSESNIY